MTRQALRGLIVGSVVAALFGRIPSWTMFVVAAHFLPFAWAFSMPVMYWLPVSMFGVVAATIACGWLGASGWYTVPGFGGALILWAGAAIGLGYAWSRRGQRESAPH